MKSLFGFNSKIIGHDKLIHNEIFQHTMKIAELQCTEDILAKLIRF